MNESAGGSFTIVGTLEATDEWSLFSETPRFSWRHLFLQRASCVCRHANPATDSFLVGVASINNTGADDADPRILP